MIHQGMQALAKADPDVAKATSWVGTPPAREREKGFEAFFATIVSQQISTAAASAILQRLRDQLPELNAEAVMAIDAQRLRDAGLSWRKVDYAKGLAAATLDGDFDAQALESMDDATAIQAITALRGFGRWSAEIYLMFSLKRADIFPADDLALRVALGRLKGLEKRPTPGQARALVEHWAPWRSVGALFLWHYYRGAPA
ncbi:DNA-3-methyladenine glycosylase 2 family protein [Halomonas sp. CH40]